MWITNQGNMVKFKTSQVWKDVRGEGVKVHWDRLIWFSQCIPRHTFILWLAVKVKLITHDKLLKWYPQKDVCCPFCKIMPDSHEHLFFQCPFASGIWTEMKIKARIRSNVVSWKDIVTNVASQKNHNNIWCIIGKLCLAATVYSIWQEGNCRIFNSEEMDKQVLCRNICDVVRSRLMPLRTKKSIAVMLAAKVWDIQFN